MVFKYIHIYRLINNNYSLIQNIDKGKGYYINKLSNNRFIIVCYREAQIYSLNKNKLYSIYLNIDNLIDIENIYEINEKELIITTIENEHWTWGVGEVNKLLIQKIEIDQNSIDNNKIKKHKFIVFFKLPDEYLIKNIFKLDDDSPYYFSNYVILKNKYYLIIIDSYLFIYNILTDTFIKEYGNENEWYGKNIIEWNCKDNDEFLVINDKSITLFKLDEIESKNNLSIELKIIANITIDYCNTKFKKIGQQNKFCTLGNSETNFFSYLERYKDKNFILIY